MNPDDDRLARFRAAMANLDPTRPAAGSAEQAWYVDRSDAVDLELADRLTLEPTCHCAVVGPIGSGKSSALRALERTLQTVPGVFPAYMEVSRLTDLSVAGDEAVLVAVAVSLCGHLLTLFPDDSETLRVHRAWLVLAQGRWVLEGNVESSSAHQSKASREAGRLQQTGQPFSVELQQLLIESARQVTRLLGATAIVLVDGLDRLPTAQRFEELVSPLLLALRHAAIGAVVVSPWRSVLGADRADSDSRFDEIGEVGPVLLPSGDADLVFFERVLAVRAVRELFEGEAVIELARASGGLLRDFIQLAKQTLTYAWGYGNGSGCGLDARRAADRLGRTRLLGLTDEDLVLLARVHNTGRFIPRSEDQQALVMTGRVLQYRDSKRTQRHRVHPTLVPFLMAEIEASRTVNAGG